MEDTDKSLIEAHCRGEATAFGELVRRHGDCVLGYLTHMTGNRDRAEDLFQETFRRVHEKAHTYSGGRFSSWLFTIATRVAIDGFRRDKRMHTVSLDREFDCGEPDGNCSAAVLAADCADPVQEACMTEIKQQVRLAVEELPARQRATLVLAYYQQLSYREVADVLGCSLGTVKMQMSRALRTLARKLPDISGAVK